MPGRFVAGMGIMIWPELPAWRPSRAEGAQPPRLVSQVPVPAEGQAVRDLPRACPPRPPV